MKNYLAFILALGLFFMGCSKSDTDPVAFGYEYYPVETGRYVEYHVTSYVYDDFDMSIDTLDYILREIIDSSFTDGEGRQAFKLRRQVRENDSLEWQLKDIWWLVRDQDRLERTEENIRFIKLAFPLKLGKTWNGNAANDMKTENYKILNLDFMSSYGSRTGEICRVGVRNNINLIEEQIREEVYAKNVGMVHIFDKDVRKNTDGSILSGTVSTFEYRSHGIQ